MYSNAHNALIIVLFVATAAAIIWAKHHKAKAAELEARAKEEIANLKGQVDRLLGRDEPKS